VWTVLAAIVLVAVIGFGAYKLKPVLYDVRHPDVRRDAIANTAAQTPVGENAPAAAAAAETATPQPDAATTAQTVQSSTTPNTTQTTAPPMQANGATEKSDSTQNTQQNAGTPAAANAPIDSTPKPAQVAAAEKTTAEKVVTEKPATEKIPVNAEEASRKQPAIAKTPAGLTPKAAQVKKKIDDALAEKNLSGKASVQGVGNTLTITGKLRPGQHAALLNLLHDVPAGVRIVDNIGDDTAVPAAPSSATTTSSVTPKTQNAATAAVSPATTASSNVPAQASANSDAPKVTGARVAWANVTSTPAGAEIYIDDFPTGQKTPARVQVSSGVHVFTLHMDGYKDVRNGIEASDGGTVAVNATLRRP
jgi:hypothetical protein